MEALRQYIVSVVAGACICAIVLGLFPESKARILLKMLCGMILALTVLHPVTKVDFGDFLFWEDGFSEKASQTAAIGEAYMDTMRRQIIKEKTAAYIHDKAEALGVSVTAEVGLDTEGIPVQVRLTGPYSPYHRAMLSEYICSTLGISKENQVWIS